MTIDERMISWKGRSDLEKYEPLKPTKWGFRPYILADTGYTLDIRLSDLEKNDEYSKTDNLVMEMMSTPHESTSTCYRFLQ